MRNFILLAGVVVLAGCSKQPDSLPEKPEFVRESRVDMNSPHADGAIIKDVMARAKGIPWRWTNQNPQLRVWLSDTANRKLHVEFAVADATFKETGPIKVTWTVNDKPLDTVAYDSAGQKTYDHPSRRICSGRCRKLRGRADRQSVGVQNRRRETGPHPVADRNCAVEPGEGRPSPPGHRSGYSAQRRVRALPRPVSSSSAARALEAVSLPTPPTIVEMGVPAPNARLSKTSQAAGRIRPGGGPVRPRPYASC